MVTGNRELEGRVEAKLAKKADKSDLRRVYRRMSKLEAIARAKGWDVDDSEEMLDEE